MEANIKKDLGVTWCEGVD